MPMTRSETDVLHRHLDACASYLEFGSGDSTIHAAGAPTVRRIDSVESSEEFIDTYLRGHAVIRDAEASARLQFHCVDIGKTRAWGLPVDDSKRHLWPNYPLSVFSEPSDHDLILIDGRFRVACALAAVLHAPDTTTILIHDFWTRRTYRPVLRYLEVVERVDSLAVFRKRAGVDRGKVKRLLERYQYRPGDVAPDFRIIGPFRRMLRFGSR